MGISNSKLLELTEYDTTKIGDIGRFLFIGPCIDDAVWQFLYHKRDIPTAVVLCPPTSEEKYRKIVTDLFIYSEYNKSLMKKIIKRQMNPESSPIVFIIEHDDAKISIPELYSKDKHFKYCYDNACKLKMCLITVSKVPINIPLLSNNSSSKPTARRIRNRKQQPQKECFDYIFVSCGNDDTTYIDAVYSLYFKQFLPSTHDKAIFDETFRFFTSKNHVIILQQDCEMFYYLPALPNESFRIGSN